MAMPREDPEWPLSTDSLFDGTPCDPWHARQLQLNDAPRNATPTGTRLGTPRNATPTGSQQKAARRTTSRSTAEPRSANFHRRTSATARATPSSHSRCRTERKKQKLATCSSRIIHPNERTARRAGIEPTVVVK